MSSPDQSPTTSTSTRLRNLIAFTCIASLSLAIVNHSLVTENEESVASASRILKAATTTTTGASENFHQSGFGGIHNINHPAGAKARRALSNIPVIIPKSAVEHAVPSLGYQNIENLHGHYVHDEHRSPFASFLYNRTKEELEEEQKEHMERMNKVREEWGAWSFNDDMEIRPIADFEKIPYKDMMNKDFPDNSWQMDQKYVTDFISEARKLVDRVREGIYAEYGHATKDLTTPEEIQARNELFQTHISETTTKEPHGAAYINEKGMAMMARKLVHCMVTNDEFYYILGGHSAAAGHGNNFQQQYTMQFANIMEPVFKKLGMRLIARNLAMGGLGTTHYSLGAATLYGETDFMYWDSGMTEKSGEDQDLFHKQVLLSGERYPVIFNGFTGNLQEETGDNLFYGNFMTGKDIVPETTDIDQVETLPWAAQYLNCNSEMSGICKADKYHCKCWITRSDYNPPSGEKMLGARVGGAASWHPGNREHQFNGRMQTMFMLRAMDEALNMWEKGIETDGFPLNESYWHVGEHYIKAQSSLSSFLTNEGFNTTSCEKRWGTIPGLDKACRISMKGMGQFTPINRGYENSIAVHLKPATNGYKPAAPKPAYEGANLLPLIWKVPEGEVDVHAIAIATTYSAPELDQSFVDDEDEDAEEAENSRRMLRKSARQLREAPAEATEVKVDAVSEERNLLTFGDEVTPGLGWTVNADAEVVAGYCDGSPMSGDCKRTENYACILSGHNDGRVQIAGDALSGWIIINIPAVKLGFIFAKLQWWDPRSRAHTKDWTEVNNGISVGGEGGGRHLGGKVTNWPEDFELDIAVNGKIIKTYNYTEFFAFTKEIAYNEAFYPLVDDESLVPGDKAVPLELGLRIRSEINPKFASFGITHIYYA